MVERGWKGVRRLKPFNAAQTRIKDERGHVQPTTRRAQVFADHYSTKQWEREALPPLPPRPALHPPAQASEGQFTPLELRKSARQLKRGKAAGTDDIANDFLLEVPSTPEGFTFVLSIVRGSFTLTTTPCWARSRSSRDRCSVSSSAV